MGLLITSEDFMDAGRYSIAHNEYTTPIMDRVITQYEESYLRQLLGVELFDLFKTAFLADPTWLNPANARFKIIYEAFAFDDKGNCPAIRQSPGMKHMAIAFLYFFIMREITVTKGVSGAKKNVSDVAANLTFTQSDIYGRYNDGVNAAESIQWYICRHMDDYPEYNGQRIEIASPYS